jgi:hypothetical protein
VAVHGARRVLGLLIYRSDAPLCFANAAVLWEQIGTRRRVGRGSFHLRVGNAVGDFVQRLRAEHGALGPAGARRSGPLDPDHGRPACGHLAHANHR